MNRFDVFISDVHLNSEHPYTCELFLKWAKQCATQAHAIYILGDLFDAWIGDDYETSFNQNIIETLAQLTSHGTPVYYLVGNHDFLIDQRFADQTGVILLPDPSIIDLFGQRVLVTHGDFMCTDDQSHLAFRRFGQKRLWRRLYMSLPLKWRYAIAEKLRKKDSGKTPGKKIKKNKTIIDVNPDTVKNWFHQHQVQTMIHGHTHKPACHTIHLNKKTTATRHVLGCWYLNAEILHWHENGHQKLHSVHELLD